MSVLTTAMSQDHRRCDSIFSQAETMINDGNWSEGEAAFIEFRNTTELHFSAEEEVLFPGFEQRTGQTMGPTQIMRMEHIQMRQLLEDMAKAVSARDREQYLGLSETLMMIMQQHNMKEEQMLYPMMDQVLGGEASQLLDRVSIRV